MADAFISYRRKPSAALAQLVQEKLRNRHCINAYVDTTRTDSTHVQFPERLMQAIEDAPVFICLLGEGTLDSEWVGKEIQRAFELQKHCIPVFQEGYVPADNRDAAVSYLLNYDGVHVFDVRAVYMDEAVAQIAALCKAHLGRRPWCPMRRVAAVLALVLIAVALILGNPARVEQNTSSASATNAIALAGTVRLTSTAETLPPTMNLTATAEGLLGLKSITETQQLLGYLTETASGWTETPTESPTQTVTGTPTGIPSRTPTHAPSPNPLGLSGNPVTTNEEWRPVVREFDGVPMVLVPSGCFIMGSSDGYDDEQPPNIQCFDSPFWIDQFEVTQEQFSRLGGVAAERSLFTGDNRPVEQVTWYEARDFCAARGARLPSEAEWEYSARGPGGLVYPWGNIWDADYAVWYRSQEQGTSDVGSIPQGSSWVGALDMIGNVREWTGSVYSVYRSDQGTEPELEGAQTTFIRMSLRGGSWGSGDPEKLRASFRGWVIPTNWSSYVGLRCVRDY